ncbi:MAG: starch-binding protein [Muribaculaceae bacterium]|nr:starch-binding protein [Muribaculaceae bacterium]
MKLKPLRNVLLWLQTVCLIGLASACSDDISNPEPIIPDLDSSTGIVLRIPNVNSEGGFDTRGESDPTTAANTTSDEGKVNGGDIYLYVFNTTDSEYSKCIHLGASNFGTAYSKLPCLDTNTGKKKYAGVKATVGTTETYYSVPMYPGTYKIYIVANLKDYVTLPDGVEDFTELTEKQLNDLTLNFTGPLSADKLPMVCMPKDVDQADGDGVFDILTTDLTTLTCNLRFLCSKVRYTVLFDNTDGGFSKASFQNNLLSFTDKNAVSKIAKQTPFEKPASTPDSYTTTSNKINLLPVGYPGGDYPSTTEGDKNAIDNDKVTNLQGNNGAWNPDGQRAWQGVVYLPENLSTDKRTQLFFDGVVNGTLSNGVASGTDGADNPYTINLITAEGMDKTSTLERGFFYDLTIKASKMAKYDLKFEIKPWERDQLIYDLHGPNYLYIDKTVVNVEAGEKSFIEYDTNVAKLDFKSAVYMRGKEAIPIYEFKEVDGKIEITVNSKLSADECQAITDATNRAENPSNDYNYFHIKAGNINKKVTVYPLSLEPFLTVEPEEITINVREQLSSGNYDNTKNPFQIVVKTNFANYKITSADWEEELGVEGNISDILYLAYKDASGNYQKVEFDDEIGKPESGRNEYYLIYKGLNDGNTFWSEKDHELTLTFTPEGKTDKAKTVKINTQRSSDNYIIYFKAPEGWKNPHIYVYQCLEIPANHDYNKNFHGKTYNMAGKPVGYYKGEAATTNEAWAALEYSFTGKIAFKGWNYGDNKKALEDSKSQFYTCNSAQGFFAFTDGCGTDDNSWNASKAKSDNRYEKKMDFCAEWRGKLNGVCKDCVGAGYNSLWPGIAMIKEGDWYRFDLSSVATPGKALIMFTDLHNRIGSELTNDYDSRRYPEKDMVGIPLFDYPNRTGYFNLADGKKYFTNTPDGVQNVQNKKYVIYYENVANWSQPYAYCWTGTNINNEFPGEAMTRVSGNLWKYESDIKYENLILNQGNSNGQSKNLTFSSGYKYKWNGSDWDITRYN